MRRLLLLVSVICSTGMASPSLAQTPLTGRALGQGVSLQMHTDQASNTWISTATLTFVGTADDRTFTIDFVTQFPGTGHPPARPRAVDMIVSEHPATENSPAMSMRLNGESLPIRPRIHSSRSVVVTLSFDEFVRLANAATVAPTAFNTEFQFSDAQLAILRTFAEEWTTRR